jgi:hypothetical protein
MQHSGTITGTDLGTGRIPRRLTCVLYSSCGSAVNGLRSSAHLYPTRHVGVGMTLGPHLASREPSDAFPSVIAGLTGRFLCTK